MYPGNEFLIHCLTNTKEQRIYAKLSFIKLHNHWKNNGRGCSMARSPICIKVSAST